MQIEQKLRKIEDLFLQIVTIWREKLYVKKFLPRKYQTIAIFPIQKPPTGY